MTNTFAEAEEVLAQRLPGYESRPQQQRMAAAVEQVLSTRGGQGLIEAGCGTGKSLGGLIPAILQGRKTIYATATIALMTQIATKDLPFLQDNLGVPFTWALVKGRANYLCHAKVAALADPSKVPALNAILDAVEADPEHTGDFEDFTGVTKQEWSNISSTAAECPGKKECPFASSCFAEAAKERGKAADVVVTNTAMLMTDLKVRAITDGYASMLGDYDAVILDEAHEVEEIATNQLSDEIRQSNFERLVGDARSFMGTQGQGDGREGQDLLDAVTTVWRTLPEPKRSDSGRMRLSWFVERFEQWVQITDALANLQDTVASVSIRHGGEKETAKRNLLVRRAQNLRTKVEGAMLAEDGDVVRYVEVEERFVKGRGKVSSKVLTVSPLRVGPFLDQWLWNRTKTDRDGVVLPDPVASVLVSATLSVNGRFDYIADRLGLENAMSLSVGTPFDYGKQSLLFVPPADAPSPKSNTEWLAYSGETTMALIDASKGGALLLFTSRTAMKASYDLLAARLMDQGLTVLMQGQDGTNKEIARTFQEDTHSVLFALKSFFTGVDFAGDANRLTVINKLPFPVPTDPMFEARSEEVERRGGSSFSDLSIPSMILTLTQGFGRLIRTKQDRGVVAILDSRLTSSAWGRKIVGALPDAPAVTDLESVRGFYA